MIIILVYNQIICGLKIINPRSSIPEKYTVTEMPQRFKVVKKSSFNYKTNSEEQVKKEVLYVVCTMYVPGKVNIHSTQPSSIVPLFLEFIVIDDDVASCTSRQSFKIIIYTLLVSYNLYFYYYDYYYYLLSCEMPPNMTQI